MKANRTYKDSLFRSIFNNPARLASLYKAISGRDTSPDDITINTLDGIFMNNVKNDISFQIGNRLVILLEHQSTWNPNMPLRFLWYVSNLYRDHVDQDIIYRGMLVKIPAPEFYIFYNGIENIPYFQQLRLADAYETPSPYMDLVTDCYNINYTAGKKILEHCYELTSYSIFTAKTREYQESGLPLADAVKAAILYCENHDLMAEYFRKHESEVYDMVSFEWNAARASEIMKEETEKTVLTKVALSLLKNKAPLKLITDSTQLSVEEIEKIAKDNGLAF